jgi:hypothetical protein
MANISTFVNSFTDDIAKVNRFDVQIGAPAVLLPYLSTIRKLNFRCENAELPSRSLATADMKIGTNPIEKHAYMSYYGTTNLTFIVGGDMKEKVFFDNWLEYINPSSTFDLNYRNDYVTTVRVNQYDNQNNLAYSIDLIDAFPTAVNQIDLDWSTDGHVKLVVVFEYRYWKNNSLSQMLQDTVNYAYAQSSNQLVPSTDLLSTKQTLTQNPQPSVTLYENDGTSSSTVAMQWFE